MVLIRTVSSGRMWYCRR